MNAHRHRPTGRTLLQRAGATAAGLLPIGRALAQGAPFPSHPITLICPWPPSG